MWDKIEIFTAKFVKFQKDGIIVDVMIDKGIKRRIFDNKTLVSGIKNLKNLIIGISVKPGTMEIHFINGNRYYKLFEECGWKLTEEEQINSDRKKKLKQILKDEIFL